MRAKKSRPRAEPDLQAMLGANLLWLGRVLNKRYEALLSRNGRGVSAAQARVLLRLHVFGPQTQKDLAVMTDVEPPTLARTLEIMEREGLVRRTRNPLDRRQMVVALAALGRRRIPVLFDLLEEVETWLTEGLPRGYVKRLLDELSAVRARLREYAPCRPASVVRHGTFSRRGKGRTS
ncbi:MAG: MarR family winged helix-turn-helix transcriptional regulator [Acidobacteriota bacterium]